MYICVYVYDFSYEFYIHFAYIYSYIHKYLSIYIMCDGEMDYSPPGSSVHGILQAKIVEWVAIPFSRGSSRPRD